MPTSVTFDANTLQILCGREPSYTNENRIELIKTKIKSGNIKPYISESIITYEMIKKNNRKDFISEYRPEYSEKINEGKVSFVLGSNMNAHPGVPEQGMYRLECMKDLGFHILKIYRTGIFAMKELRGFPRHVFTNEIHNRWCSITDELYLKGFGFKPLESIGNKYDKYNWQNGIGKAPESESKKIDYALAEWSDSDSIATHLAHNIELFCTNDKAKSAGSLSIMNPVNISLLNDLYGLKCVSFDELCELFE